MISPFEAELSHGPNGDISNGISKVKSKLIYHPFFKRTFAGHTDLILA